MNVRTLQAPTRERLSPILTSTKKIVTVERTETCRGERDFRIQGLPHSAVQEHDHIRKKAVQKLIHQFEESSEQRSTTSQPNTKSRVQSVQRAVEGNDLQQGNMEYFEICEITPNIQCTNCMTDCPKGIVYCTCGTCLRPSDKVRKLNSDRCDVLSIPNYVIKKGPSHGRRHGNMERQRIYHPAHVSSRKAEKEGVHFNTG